MPQVSTKHINELVKTRKNMFGTLDINPKNFYFETQDRGEKVYIKARAHPFINFGWVMNSSFLLVLPLFVWYFLSILPIDLSIFGHISFYSIIVILSIYYSIAISMMFFNFLDWYYDLYLVTNIRIINIQFDPLKQHRISEAKLEHIEHVDESMVGFFPSILNYGDVKVSTAARRGMFIFRAVPDPAWFRDVIMDLSRYIKGE